MPAPHGNCTIRAFAKMEKHPEKCALWSVRDGVVSFRQLGEMASVQQAGVERLGIGTGQVVMVMALPGPQLFATLLAFMGLGVGVVFVEPWMKAADLEKTIATLGIRFLFGDRFGAAWRLKSNATRRLDFHPLALFLNGKGDVSRFKVLSLDQDLPALISFTTGTTGAPKGVVRSHSYLWDLHEILEKYGDDAQLQGPDLSIFPNMGLYHIGTGRGSLLVPAHWSPSVLQRIKSFKREMCPQSLSCGPAFLRHLLDHNFGFQSLKSIHVGGALVECDLLERAHLALPGCNIKLVYGGTEVEPISFIDAKLSVERSRSKGFLHALNVGEPIQELNTRFDERGILWVSGPNVCPEYMGNPEETALLKSRDSDGRLWHCTGDRLLHDSNGLWFMGRGRQPVGDFLTEQKLYARLGHTRAYIHRDNNQQPLVVVDDDVRVVAPAARDLLGTDVKIWAVVLSRDRRHRSRIDRQMTWEKGLRMVRWWTYVKERSPLLILTILACGPIASGFLMAPLSSSCKGGLSPACSLPPFNFGLAFAAVIASIVFMLEARVMDEIKDFEKDKLANPQRPLPRGLVSLEEMNIVLRILMLVLLTMAFVIGLSGATLSGVLFGGASLYLWLMYKEFYVGQRLNQYPFIYALTHQWVGIPLYLFGFSLFDPNSATAKVAWLFVGINVFASLSYEFARKLKPDVHPAAQTYRQIYGLKSASVMALVFQLAAVVLSAQLFLTWRGAAFLFLLQIPTCVLLLAHAHRDRLHKACEGFAALSVLTAAWIGLVILLIP